MKRNLSSRVKKATPTILSIVAVAGVVGTAVMAVLATPKAEKKIEEAKKDKLSKVETFIFVAPVYLPSIGLGIGTITCILGANALNKKQQASLISALALGNRSFVEYKNKTANMLGADGEKEIRAEIAKDHLKDVNLEEPLYDDEALFYESYSGRYFTSKMKDVREAEYHINRNFALRGYVTFNELCEFYGIDKVDGGDEIGWSIDGYDFYGYAWVDFTHDKINTDDGLECYMISYPFWPHNLDDDDYA